MILKIMAITFSTIYIILAVDMAKAIIAHKKSNKIQSDSTTYTPEQLDEEL
jgi:hypothetical protein